MPTPVAVTESVVRSVCGRDVEDVVTLAGGSSDETFRVRLTDGWAVVVRVARSATPSFVDEAHLMAQARAVGVPAPEVLGVEHVEAGGELLSVSVRQLVPGRPLGDLVAHLTRTESERLVADAGELLARVHSIAPGDGVRHELQSPDEPLVARARDCVANRFGAAAGMVVERGADLVREQVMTRPAPPLTLAHGDFLPKHLMVDGGVIVGVIDWEFAGSARPAHDLARWQVSAGDPLHDHGALLYRGYARVSDPEAAAHNWVPAVATAWALEVLGWTNPATPAQVRRCLDVIAQHATA